jgi:tetratricopeptide (TPR) repeat protein
MTNPMDSYKSLIARPSLVGLSSEAALHHLGLLIDASLDVGRPEGLRHAIALSGGLSVAELSPADAATLQYFLGNAWTALRRLVRQGDDEAWEWHQEEFAREITHLRLALRSEGFAQLPLVRQCRILTNLGNAMSEIGRFVEATAYLSQALELDTTFGMARGNRGLLVARYARALYDSGHSLLLLSRASEDLRSALGCPHLEPGAREAFEARDAWIAQFFELNGARDPIDLENYPLGKSKSEKEYRRWCLANRPFLNPLNDLGPHAVASHDVLTAPSITTGLDEGPSAHGFFNQLKQEFVSARYLYYEGVSAGGPHFSDRGVLLYNTLDYPAYSLAVEKVKASFRMGYSLFDKFAFFLNTYLRLGIPEVRVTSKTFWYTGQERKRGLRPEFAKRPNWPLRGLFWLSQDLYEPAPGFREALVPDAEQLAEIRNHLEHKYLRLRDMLVARPTPDPLADSLAFSIGRQDFEAKTFRLLTMARAALIYLSLAVHEEERRKKRLEGEKPVMPMLLDRWEDQWKR